MSVCSNHTTYQTTSVGDYLDVVLDGVAVHHVHPVATAQRSPGHPWSSNRADGAHRWTDGAHQVPGTKTFLPLKPNLNPSL
jgi:hypothetical protein